MIRKLRDFFWLCSGADLPTLEKCPTESTKYAGIGATIFFTGIFAALAGAYALYTVFDNIYAALGFGIVWGLMIFNLDRYIVSSMRKRKNRSAELLMATPRIVLALLISVVIAKPLELKIFQKEIEGEIALMQQEDFERKLEKVKSIYTQDIQGLAVEIDQLKQEVEQKARQRDQLQTLAQQEADGTGGTKQRNAGPIYRIKKADADKAQTELEELKAINDELITKKLAQRDSIHGAMATEIQRVERGELNGLASRLEALSRIGAASAAIYWAGIFIMILFMAVESAPVLVKLMSPEGPYDHMMVAQNHRYEVARYEEVARENTHIRKRSEKLTPEEKTYVKEQLDVSLQNN